MFFVLYSKVIILFLVKNIILCSLFFASIPCSLFQDYYTVLYYFYVLYSRIIIPCSLFYDYYTVFYYFYVLYSRIIIPFSLFYDNYTVFYYFHVLYSRAIILFSGIHYFTSRYKSKYHTITAMISYPNNISKTFLILNILLHTGFNLPAT